MKKYLLLFFGILMYSSVSAQAYHSVRLAQPDIYTTNSHDGIDVSSITPKTDGSYSVELFNSNYNNGNEIVTYAFEWYLSYKGKRVSDYYKSAIRNRKSEQKTVWAWPDEVPRGNEQYVTVQFGKEPPVRDRRDDD